MTNSISDRLRDLRAQKGASQDEVAEACDMSRVALARYETGTRIPRAEYVSRLADFYGVTVDYLMGRDAPAEPAALPETIPEWLAGLNPENRAFIQQMAKKLLESQGKSET